MALALSDLKNIVDTGRFDSIVGEIEGQFFDAKGQPYQFDVGMDAKREFAKDVAAFANAGGGFILIGLTTTPSAVRAGEEVLKVRPIDSSRFDPDQHRKILLEWLYPQPMGIDVKWIQFGSDEGKGIGVIYVPAQNERSKPFLMTRTLGDKKSTELLIGYVERRIDATKVRTVVEIHQALRTGLNLERELLGRIENIELLVERHFSATNEAETAEKRAQVLQERIARLLDEAKG
jgi:hypothetical protein